MRFPEAESRTVEEKAPSTSEEGEKLTEEELEESRQVQRESMEAVLWAARLSRVSCSSGLFSHPRLEKRGRGEGKEQGLHSQKKMKKGRKS